MKKPPTATTRRLRRAIFRSLRQQGYKIEDGLIRSPDLGDKGQVRDLHRMVAKKVIDLAEPAIGKYEPRIIKFIANGNEVEPERIKPRLELVESDTWNSLIFRHACLHWSIPVSKGYGRRIRFLVIDENNGKLIGIIGLGDPVFSLRDRDNWIGWNYEAKKRNLYHVMDAYVLGAVPPYSQLLCGKLVAMLALSNEVRSVFKEKYFNNRSLISKAKRPPYLGLLTTSSALGRSSVYNRIRVNGYSYWKSVGNTQGSGELHFSNGVYEDIYEFVSRYSEPTAKRIEWGTGFRNKREVVRRTLQLLGLPRDLIYHGIRREIFVAPLGMNSAKFLRGEITRPKCFDWPADTLSEMFKNRWLLSRAERCPAYREFQREQYLVWPPLD